jgi:hypothetical protein
METMLNEKSSPNVENTETKSFSTFKIIAIMTTLLLLIWIISSQFSETKITLNENENEKSEIAENRNADAQNPKNLPEPSFRPEYSGSETPEGNHREIGTGGTKLNNAQNKNPNNNKSKGVNANINHPEYSGDRHLNTNTDTSIINNALTSYTAHYQNEKVFIHLDKTIYKPTEAVWFNVFVRNSNRLTASLSEIVYVELVAPNGKTLKTLTLLSSDGMAAGDFQLTDDFVGGLYKIKAYTKWQQNTGESFEKTLQVQKTVLPKLNMKLEFARKAYGAGDEVVADLTLETVTNQALANQDFEFTVSLAGQQILKEKAKTDGKGKTEIKFLLPKNLNTNDGLLNVMIPHNGSTESIARSVPIVLNKIDVQFLPEGGDLVADLKSNIAFKAVNEFGQPADIEGEIYNKKGEKVTTFSSYYQGMGGFDLLAKADEKYTAKITKPVGITEVYDLPLAKAETAILNIITQTKEKITVRIASNVKANYVLAVTAREAIVFTEILNDLDGEKTIEINTKDFPIGITQLTLFASPENSGNGRNQAIAERLAFINPHQQLHIEIETDKENYKLRETVKAKIKVTDENGNAVKGQFSVSVVDETLLSHADDKQANLLAYFLLCSDLKGEIKEPNFYFEKEEETDKINKQKALDYVLLTHGWRRFAWEQVIAGNFPRFGYPHETTKFQGQVVDAFNRPLANANVEVKGRKNKDITTVTDVHGRFLLDKIGLLPPFTIKASYEEFDAKQDINSYAQSCQIKLMANYSRDIHGRVVDYRSRNVEGAKIEITGNGMKTLTAVSDKSGNFMIPNVDLHKYNQVEMTFEGIKLNQPLYQYTNGNTVLFNTEMNKISDLTGQAVTQRGEDLEGVAVTIDGMTDTVYTNKKGRFVLPNVDFSRFQYVKGIYAGGIRHAYIRTGNEPIIRFYVYSDLKIVYENTPTSNPVIKGKVIDKTGESLIGTTLRITNSTIGTVTDLDGNYEIKNLKKGTYNMEVSYMGYEPVYIKNIKIDDKNVLIDFLLSEQSAMLNDVVVVGYGTTRPAEFETVTEQVLVKPATTRLVPVPAEYKMENERVEVSPAVYETITKTVLIKPATTRAIEIPAEYQTVTKQIVKTPAQTRTIEIPAEYKSVSKQVETSPGVFETITESVLVKEAYTRIETIPAEYETVTEQVLRRAARTGVVGVPAEYGTITEQVEVSPAVYKNVEKLVLKTPATTTAVEVPAEYQTITKQVVKNNNETSSNNLNEIVVTYQVPLVTQDNTTQGTAINTNEAKRKAEEIEAARVAAEKLEKEKATKYARQNMELQKEGDKAAWNKTVVTAADIQKIPSKNISGIVVQNQNIGNNRADLLLTGTPAQLATDGESETITINSTKWEKRRADKNALSANPDDALVWALVENNVTMPKPQGGFDRATLELMAGEYGYAANYKNGYYKARTFYTPKYEDAKAVLRNDFRTTLYWENALETNEKGEAEFEFPNADVTTNYRITVAGFSDDGQIGLNTEKYFVQMPFALQTKVPNSILTGDKLTIPVTLMNNTDGEIEGELLIEVPTHFELLNDVDKTITLAAKTTKVVQLAFLIGNEISQGSVNIRFEADDFEDAFATNIQTISRGFPVNEVFGDNKVSTDFEFNLREPLDGTLDVKLTVHPNILSDLVTGVDRMFQQPSGCFEQVSSSNYPNLLALNYMRNANIRNQQIEGKAERFLAIGYDKMKSYEVEGGGFDWWGKAPAHEGLTAYGLMQLVDMANVFEVDKALIDRTANWLLERRDGEGNWQVKKGHLHNWVENQLMRNAYIMWGLTEAGYGDKLSKEINANYKKILQSEDAYMMALMANTLSILNDERADDLIEALLKMQKEDGSWVGKSASITFSKGNCLTIETTALVILAIMDWEADEDLALRKAIDFIAKSKNEYGFGSTQSTVLAMKALVEYADYSQNMGEDGKIILYKGDREIAVFDYTKDMNQPIVFDNLQAHFFDKKNKLKVRFVGTEKALSYDLSVNYHTALPQGSPTAPIFIETKIENPKAKVGETVRLSVTLQNNRYETLQNPIAIVGIPSGLTLQPWQLRELQEKNVADYVELWNGYIVFYFRELGNNKVINLDLKAETAGTFEAPASSAYLYYDNEEKSWSLPEKVIVW